MRTAWQDNGKAKAVTAPLSLVISAFAPVVDVRQTLTPQLRTDSSLTGGATDLILVDLGNGKNRLGGSILAQVYNQMGDVPADLDSAAQLKGFFNAMQACIANNEILAYHDRSDGGLFATIAEMAFAGHVGVDVDVECLGDDVLAALFNEEAGAVLQVAKDKTNAVLDRFFAAGVTHAKVIGTLNDEDTVRITQKGTSLFDQSRAVLQSLWSETSYRIQAMRDNPACAKSEFEGILKIGSGARTKIPNLQATGIKGEFNNINKLRMTRMIPRDTQRSVFTPQRWQMVSNWEF
jgi:phosphoribosylformylglycinamidine synthase